MYSKISLINGVALAWNTTLFVNLESEMIYILSCICSIFISKFLPRRLFTASGKSTRMRIYQITVKTIKVFCSKICNIQVLIILFWLIITFNCLGNIHGSHTVWFWEICFLFFFGSILGKYILMMIYKILLKLKLFQALFILFCHQKLLQSRMYLFLSN